MSDTNRHEQSDQRQQPNPRRGPSKKALILVAAIAVFVLAYFALPHPINRLYTVDGERSWTGDSAPTRRSIVWQSPAQIKLEYPDSKGRESLIRPLLTNNGNTLYFTLRNQNGESDIYRSRLVDGKWQSAELVEQLNSPADDIGSFITPDGSHFYLASDRKDGGYGGFDLYVSTRTADGWSKPQNLGPQINTPANEYSPSLAADGRRLFFSSNRNQRMQKRAELIAEDAAAEWDETIRAQQGLVQYDLYVTRRDGDDVDWQAAEPLAGANHDNSNEGTPFVSLSGVFLYFSSDRPNGSGRQANYDIYRGRLGKTGVTAIENLGPGVNTAANELDPALATHDFQLVFSSDRDSPNVEKGADDLYALYASTAVEVYEETEWSESKLAPLADYWWWILLALLILALLVALVWAARKMSWRRIPVPTFLLIALLFHLLFATGMFFVGLGGELAEKVRNELENLVSQDFGEDPEEIHPTERPEFDKVTDLETVETVQPTEVTRQVASVPNVPVPTQSIAPALPTVRVDQVPVEQALVLPPKAEIEVRQTPQLTRRRTVDAANFIEQPTAATEAPVSDSKSQPSEIRTTEVDVARNNPAQQPKVSSDSIKQLALESNVAPESDAAPLSSPATPTLSPSNPTGNPQLARARSPVEFALATEKATAEKVDSSVQTASAPPSALAEEVAVNRTGTRPNKMSLPGTLPDAAAKSARPIGEPTVEADQLGAAPISDQAVPASFDVKLDIARRPTLRLSMDRPSELKPVPTDAAEPTNATTGGDGNGQESVAVNLARGVAPSTPPRVGVELTGSSNTFPSNVKADSAPLAPASQSRDALASASNYSAAPELVRKRVSLSTADGQAETEAVSSPADLNATTQQPVIAGVAVGVDRPEADFLKTPVKTDSKLGGAHQPQLRRLVLAGKVGDKPIEAPVRLASASSGLPRRATRGPAAFYADAGAGMERMFDLRRSETKTELVKMFGGNDESLKSVQRGLTWIEKHQFEDGHWSLHEFNKCCQGHPRCSGHGNVKSDVAATGFGLLPFLGFGETHLTGAHQKTIGRGLNWLVEHQQSSGELTTGKEGNARMYSHAIGTIALCEAYGLSQDPNLREPAQRAVDFILNAQHRASGGWRYQPNQSADTSVVGWQLMALKSGQIAGLYVPHESWGLVQKWLDKVEGKGKQRGQFRYQPGQGYKLAMTAEGLLCRRYLGATVNDPSIVQGANHLLQHLPQKNKDSSYYWYYATQFMFHLSPEYWDKWNEVQNDLLTNSQIKEGRHFGTWDPRDNWERQGGRLYATSLRVMMLEVFYRHQPLYKLFDQ